MQTIEDGLRILLFLAGCSAALSWLARRAAVPGLGRLIAAAFGLRLVTALSLFCVSYWRLPVFQSLQAAPGFWWFTPDTVTYHTQTLEIIAGWHQRHSLRTLLVTNGETLNYGPEYFLFLALLYGLFGSHPLVAVLANITLSCLQVLASVQLVRSFTPNAAALRRAGWIVACWPSNILWASQILKDPLALLMSTLLILAVIRLLGNAKGRDRLAWWATLLASIVLTMRLRNYVAASCFAALYLMLLAVCCQSLVKRRPAGAVVVPVLRVALGFGLALSLSHAVPDLREIFGRTDLLAPQQSAAAIPAPRASASENPAVSARPAPALMEAGIACGLRFKVPPEWTDAGRRLIERVATSLSQFTPANLVATRTGFLTTGGATLVDRGIALDSPLTILASVPQALVLSILSPVPAEWFMMGASTGAFRLLASIEMALFYLAMLWILRGSWRLLRTGGLPGAFLLLALMIMTLGTGLVVANVGTLFRIRLTAFLPWLAIGLALGFTPHPLKQTVFQKS